MRLREVILRGTRAAQPAAADVDAGVLYCVSDEGNLIERSNGAAWEAFSPIGGPGAGGAVQDSFIVSGGGVTWEGTDYLYRVAAAVYYIKGVRYTSLEQTIALSASDPANDRIDVLALDTTGTLVVVEGTPAPAPSEPDVDPSLQLKLAIVIVKAASTVPDDVTTETLYAEAAGGPGEWNWTASGASLVVNSLNNPKGGTRCIEGTAVPNGAYVQAQLAAGTIDPNAKDRLTFYIRSKAAWNSGRVLRVQWFNAGVARGTPLTIASGYWGFDSSITTGYQLVVLPIPQFAIPLGTLVNQLRITNSGGSIGFYIDDVQLQTGGGTGTSTSGLTQDQADARYAALVHAARHASGGADAIKLDDLAAPDDNTDLNVSTARHGLAPKGDNDPTHFLNGQGAYTAPAAGVTGPGLSEDGNIALFDGVAGDKVKDGAATIAEVIATAAAAGAAAAPQGDVIAPGAATEDHLATFGADREHLKDSGKTIAQVVADALAAAGTGDVVSDAAALVGNLAAFTNADGKHIGDATVSAADIIAAAVAAVALVGYLDEAAADLLYAALTHASRHAEGGADAITVTSAMLSGDFAFPGSVKGNITLTEHGALSGDLNLTANDAVYHTADPNGANRNVNLHATPAFGCPRYVKHVGASNKLVVKDNGGTTVKELAAGESVSLAYGASAWVVL